MTEKCKVCKFEVGNLCEAIVCYSSELCNARDETGNPKYADMKPEPTKTATLLNNEIPKTVESLDSILKRFESDNDSGVNEAKQELSQWHKQEMVRVIDKQIIYATNRKLNDTDHNALYKIQLETLSSLRSKILEGGK